MCKAWFMTPGSSWESGGGEHRNENVIVSDFHALCFPKGNVKCQNIDYIHTNLHCHRYLNRWSSPFSNIQERSFCPGYGYSQSYKAQSLLPKFSGGEKKVEHYLGPFGML